MKIIGLLPARGGSKGIKNKNIAKLNGKPLLQYTAVAANKSNFLDETFISTDDKKIYQIAKKLGISFLSYRPKNLSTDNSKIIDVLVHFLKEFKKKEIYHQMLLCCFSQRLRFVIIFILMRQ